MNDDGSAKSPHREDNIEYARACYTNLQEIIRFVDTKTSVLTGIITVTTSVPLVVFKYLLTRNSAEPSPAIYWYAQTGMTGRVILVGAALVMTLGFIFGLLSLLASTSGLMSRMPRHGRDKQESLWEELGRVALRTISFGRFGKHREIEGELTCLFPVFRTDQAEAARRIVQKLAVCGYSSSEILAEYAAQLESVGSILNIKINRNRGAVVWFERQIFAYLACVMITWLAISLSIPTNLTDKAEPKPTATMAVPPLSSPSSVPSGKATAPPNTTSSPSVIPSSSH